MRRGDPRLPQADQISTLGTVEWARRLVLRLYDRFRDIDDDMNAGPVLQSYTVAGLPSAADYPSKMVYVSNEAGGAVPAFSDGTNWRRVTDRSVVS